MLAVIGLGFNGLTIALGFADKGVEVYGVDTDTFHANLIKNGKIPFFEPCLDDALERNLGKTFHVLTNIEDVPDKVKTFLIRFAWNVSVSTP